MGLWSRLRESLGTTVVARVQPQWLTGRPLPGPHEFYRLADQGYRANVIIYACINEIARTVAEPRLIVQRGSEVSSTHPLVALLERPNRDTSQYDLLEQILVDLHICGNAFIHKVRSETGSVVELWRLRPDRMKYILGDNGMIKSWSYEVPGATPQIVLTDDLIHFTLTDPLDDYLGLSPLHVISSWEDLDTSTVEYLRAFFRNAGSPKGLLELKARSTKEQRNRLREAWKENYGGGGGFHSVGVLDSEAKYTAVGSKPEELSMGAIFDHTESRIAAAFAIPPLLVGLHVGLLRSTFANYASARRSFWEETMTPIFTRVADRLTLGLAADFGGRGLRVAFDLSNVVALQTHLPEVRAHAVAALQAGLLSQEQAFALCDYPLEVRQMPGPSSTPEPSVEETAPAVEVTE